MIKVIDGLRYNTATAEEIDTWWNGYAVNDFKHCQESLYKTKKGSYFIYGEGGAMSQYCEPCGDMFGSGSQIIPVSPEAAFVWASEHCDATKIEKYFADMIEDA